jgi:hypothetical protein
LLEIAPAVYPHDSGDRAEQRLYGVLGAFVRRSYRYGKKERFFTAYWRRRPDGSLALGYFAYVTPAENGRVAAQGERARVAAAHPLRQCFLARVA